MEEEDSRPPPLNVRVREELDDDGGDASSLTSSKASSVSDMIAPIPLERAVSTTQTGPSTVEDDSTKPSPVLERSHTSSELLSHRAREYLASSSRTQAEKTTYSTSPVGASTSSSTSFEIESVRLPASGITEAELEKTTHTVFTVEVRLHGGLQWMIQKRYSDFRELHDKLKRTNPQVKQLHFPKRHVFRNRHQSVIEQRRSELEKYINEVLEIRPLIRVPLFNFLEVYAHMESYERKLQRHKKELEWERMKNLLDPQQLEDYSAAFKRLCSSKYLYHGSSGSGHHASAKPDAPDYSNHRSSNPSSPSKEAAQGTASHTSPKTETGGSTTPTTAASPLGLMRTAGSQICISRASFRRDILGVFPDMPSNFAMRFMKAVSDRQASDINMDEFLRAVAILRCGTLDDKLKFVFNMCDLDHAGKVQSSGLGSFLVSLHGRHVQERLEYGRLMNEGFEHGRARMTAEEFVTMVLEQSRDVTSILVGWMGPFVDTLCETADPQLLESQEEFNPVVQQKILATETDFNVKEVSILQDAFNNYRASGGGDVVDMDALSSDFPLEMSEERFARVFSSFGSRANGTDIDVFSFVHALAIACRGKPDQKAKFAFTLFTTNDTPLMRRDDLYAMLRLDLAQNPKLEQLVVSFVESRNGRKASVDHGTAIGSKAPPVSGTELGLFVNEIMKTYGKVRQTETDAKTENDSTLLALTLEEFTAWSTKESYEMAALRIMREVVFIDLGLIPTSKEEETLIAKGCYKPYEPSALIEDDYWFLIERKWFEHWCKYINLPFQDFYTAPPTPPSTTTSSSTSLVELSMMVASNALHGSRGASSGSSGTSSSKDPPIMDADGHILRPKCINNYVLLTSSRALKSQDEIKLGKHFVIICEQLWMALKLWYGGGPEIRRKVIVQHHGATYLDIWGTEAVKHRPKKNAHGNEEDECEDSHSEDEKESADKQITALPRRMRSGGSVGLTNLGNTCYMNSALQCLTNTQLLAEYFLSGMYLDDINRTSTLGLQGKLAEVYGKLAEDMWCAKQKAISPRNFKKTIGRFNEAFRGTDQQDAQELLAFLLSGLSEDLNRIQDKPYVEQPDSDGRYDSDLADEWWRNHLRREVSIIVALFTGQYKSLLTCSVCGFKSARFEPFTFLQVPLPEPTHSTVTVLFVLSNGMTPMKVSVRLGIAASIFDLKHELATLCHKEFNLRNITEADIKVCEYSGSMLLSFKTDNRRLGQIRSIDRLVAFQLEPLDPEIIQLTRYRRPSYVPPSSYRHDESESDRVATTSHETFQKGSLVEVKLRAQSSEYIPAVVVESSDDLGNVSQVTVQIRGEDRLRIPVNRVRPRQARLLYIPLLSRKLSYSAVYFKNPFRPVPFGIPNLVRICPERTTGFDLYKLVWERVHQYVPDASPPAIWEDAELTAKNRLVSNRIDGIFTNLQSSCGFLLRRVESKGLTDSRSSWLLRSFGWTIPCTNDALDILEEETIAIDWDLSVFQDRGTLEKMKHVALHSSVAQNEAIDKGPVPLRHCLDAFTSEEKISEGYCSSCCTHQEMTKKLEIWRLPPVMVVHLKRFQYTQTYRRKLGSLVEFPIMGLDLATCVAPHVENPERYPMKKRKEMAAVTEEIVDAALNGNEGESASKTSKDDEGASENGSTTQTEAKSEDVMANRRPPLTRARRGYTNTNLEQSRCLETKYDLYGVVNHQGALGGGHYTAYAKNFMDNQWYYYDDERVRVIEESRVVSPSAYLLFYLRSDMHDVVVKDLYPANSKGKITDEDIDRFVEEGDERRCAVM